MYSLYIVYTMYSYSCEDFSLRISIDVNTKYYTKPFLKLYNITILYYLSYTCILQWYTLSLVKNCNYYIDKLKAVL